MVLNESLRILSGLQESQHKENPLPKLLEQERIQLESESFRKSNSKKIVLDNFEKIETSWLDYTKMFETVQTIFNHQNKKTFINGLIESKYNNLQQLFDILINESMSEALLFLINNYKILTHEISAIEYITEEIDQTNISYFFATKNIKSNDIDGLEIITYKYKNLTELVSDKILYGSEISYISENLAVVRENGQKYFLSISSEQFKKMIDVGLII